MEKIAIFAALQWECRPILRRIGAARRENVGGFVRWRAQLPSAHVTLIKTGMGLERAERAARVLEDEAFDVYVSTGCAGALADHLEPGSLVIAESVRLSGEKPLDTHALHRERLVGAAKSAGIEPALGGILSSPTILTGADARRAAAAAGPIAVEMEGASIARAAAARSIAFCSVRSILDTASTEVEPTGNFVDPATGGVRPLALAGHIVRHPGAVMQLLAMKKLMDAAEGSLNRFFDEYLK